MADFIYGLRRALGFTTPEEDADMREREAQMSRTAPGTALRERQDTMDAAMQELRNQGVRPAAVQPAAPVAPPPAQDFSAPRYGEDVAPALRALEGYGVRSSVNPVSPSRTPEQMEEDERRRQQRPGMGGIRG